MPFNSFEFIFLFLPIAAIVFNLLRRAGHHNRALEWLTVCSLVFYSWGGWQNLPVLLASILFNYAMVTWLEITPAPDDYAPNPKRRNILLFGISINLLLLGYYKYFNQLPLGLSFFTLAQVMYLVDCYEGLAERRPFRWYVAFVSFFPSVAMGPILSARNVFQQFESLGTAASRLAPGLMLFSIGCFKKVVIADSISPLVDVGFEHAHTLSMLEGWMCSLSYTLQIYYDFSGYSDMAIAVGLMLGIKMPFNFNSPYHSRSIVEFWQRWHMTLSSFITNYMYTPLVRARGRSPTFTWAMISTFISMVIVGIWHGSSWNYVVFGAMHGAGLVVNQYRKKLKSRPLPDLLAWLLTMLYVNLAFIFFRASNLSDAYAVLGSLVNVANVGGMGSTLAAMGGWSAYIIFGYCLGYLLILVPNNSNRMFTEFRASWWMLLTSSTAMYVALTYMNSVMSRDFVYRNF